jgi:D-arabinose 1-dehydrogenase
MAVPEVILGGASISAQYNSDVHLNSDMPLRTVRLALRCVPFGPALDAFPDSIPMSRYGVRAIDTSPYYGMSEIILGSVLRALAPEFPRQSYRLMTKVGRYGITKEDFDYSPQSLRLSIMRSLQRLNTAYLDVVFLHDIEYIASPVWPIPYCGDFERVLNDKEGRADWGLLPGKEGKAWGTGDETILTAVRELFKMKAEGLIRAVGISGMYSPAHCIWNAF